MNFEIVQRTTVHEIVIRFADGTTASQDREFHPEPARYMLTEMIITYFDDQEPTWKVDSIKYLKNTDRLSKVTRKLYPWSVDHETQSRLDKIAHENDPRKIEKETS